MILQDLHEMDTLTMSLINYDFTSFHVMDTLTINLINYDSTRFTCNECIDHKLDKIWFYKIFM